jgi:branched-chain amino acid transport system permease protein
LENSDKTNKVTTPYTSEPLTPEASPPAPSIGSDEWAAQVEGRRRKRASFWGRLADLWERLPLGWRYALALALLVTVPLLTGTQPFLELIGASNNDFILRTGARFLIFAMLAIGLNVIVGNAGLLDLGYVAFFGIAGYLYAYSSSDFVTALGPGGVHLPSLISVPLIILVTAGIGWLVGSVSLRLSGDYLAIVTLGFGLVFVQLALTATRVNLPWLERPVDFTRGPNGINHLDGISVFGYSFTTTLEYYYLFLALLILVYLTVHHLNLSRIGRAWRAIREDELAAEILGTPTGRLKLLAFAIGAGIAALAGSVDAAWQGNVVPVPRYSALTLINLYAMVVLGGIGSLPGAVLGAFIFTVLPEVLRDITAASFLFYGFGLMGLWAVLKPMRRFALVVGGTIASGLLFKLLVRFAWPGLDSPTLSGSWLNQAIQSWLVIPPNFTAVGNVVTILAIFVLLLTILFKHKPGLFHLLLGLSLYLFAFAWETRLALEPAATRILIVGVTLVVLMIVRPQGLLGKEEVKVA